MAKGMPSMVALLGLLAVAGYQNRDKLGSVLGGLGGNANGTTGQPGSTGGLDGMLGNVLGGAGLGAGAGGLGSILSGGLGEIVERFNGSGHGTKAQSWVQSGANEDIDTRDLEHTLGADTIEALQQQTGLSKEDLLDRLSKTLPDAVNRLTPEGRIPTESEASRFV